MADDRTVYKLEGDASGLIRSLKGTSRALDTTAKKADKTDKEIKQLGDQSKKTATKTAGLSKSLGKLNVSFKALSMGAGMLAAGILAAGAATGKFLQSMADAQNELGDLSARTGVATKTLAGLRLAAKGSGQDFKAVSSALKPLTLRLGQAAQGSKTAVEGFKAVGVEVLDAEGKLRSADDVLLEISGNLNDMEDPTERAAAAALAFGSAGTKLVQALGGQDLKVFVDAAERFGMDTGPEAAKAADDWQRAMADLDMVMRPFVTDVLVWATDRVNDFMLGWVFISTLLKEFGKNLLPNVGNLIKAFAITAMIDIHDMAYNIATTITGAFGDVVEWIESFTGGDKWTKAFAKAHEETAKVKAGVDAVLDAQLVQIGTTTDLGKAYEKAFEEAKAFYDYLQIETTKAGGGGGLPGKDDGKTGGPLDIDLSKSGGAGIIIHDKEDAEEEISTLLRMSDVAGTLADNMNELTDPTGVFRDLMGEIAGTFVALEEIDFKQPMGAIEGIGKVAKSMGNIFGSVIDSIIKSNDKLTKKQRATLMVLFTLQKAASLVSIAMDTAAALQKTFLMGPVAGPIFAGIITASSVIQAGVVAAQKPPFHVGGIIPANDQMSVPINALPGESVLNREATAGLGAEGVANLNSGIAAGGTQVIEMIYKHRVFDNFIKDNISKGGPLNDAINGNRKVGHRRRG